MATTTIRFLALGDSYTIGEGVPGTENWPNRLVQKLRDDGISVADPEIIAVTGWTTDELQSGINESNPQGPYDLVSLLIGVNNQYRQRPLGEYKSQFQELLTRAITFADSDSSRVFVVSIPDWGVTPLAFDRDKSRNRSQEEIAVEIDAFNEVAKSLAGAAGISFIDITPLSRTQGEQVVDDDLHPNARAYEEWVELMLPTVKNLLIQS